MENLDNALAELASQLGVSVSQLWDWMQGYGIKAYASAKIGTLASEIAVQTVVFVMTILVAWLYVSKVMPRLVEHDRYMADEITIALFILFGITAAISLVVAASVVPELVGWIASPEGMVIKNLMEAL